MTPPSSVGDLTLTRDGGSWLLRSEGIEVSSTARGPTLRRRYEDAWEARTGQGISVAQDALVREVLCLGNAQARWTLTQARDGSWALFDGELDVEISGPSRDALATRWREAYLEARDAEPPMNEARAVDDLLHVEPIT